MNVADLYHHISTPSLLDLQAAFLIDVTERMPADARAFVALRLALIEAELKARGVVGP